MLISIRPLVEKAQAAADPRAQQDGAIDLLTSLLEHLAVTAIAAYRDEGARDPKVNAILADQLPWPSMGSWRNFLDAIARSSDEAVPRGFRRQFLVPLLKRVQAGPVPAAYAAMGTLVQPDEDDGRPAVGGTPCSALEFLERAVTYRNRFVGHGTQSMSRESQEAAPLLRDAAVDLAAAVAPLWDEYPLCVARRDADRNALRLDPLTDSGAPRLLPASVDLPPDRVYVAIDGAGRAATVHPVVVYLDGGMYFLNGAVDLRQIRYLDFVSGQDQRIDSFEGEFCEFLKPFRGGVLTPEDLVTVRGEAHARMLEEIGWTFPSLKPGALIGTEPRRYRLLSRIRSGGMAEVWEGEAVQSHRRVAIKLLRDVASIARFRRESRVLAGLCGRTERLVQHVDFGFDGVKLIYFMVMELLSKKTVEDAILDPTPTPVQKVLEWMEDCLVALCVLHREGVIHRDIKPSNLLLDANGRVKLGDLGLVGIQEGRGESMLTSSGLTQVGHAMGTYQYSALEQLLGGTGPRERPVSERSDLFSVGATFYHLLTWQLPYGRSDNQSIITGNQTTAEHDPSARPPAPIQLREDCPQDLSDLVQRLIEVDPDLRPDAAETVLDEVRDIRRSLTDPGSNAKLNLFQGIGGNDVGFEDLMPSWLSFYVWRVWPAAMLLEFVVLGGMCLAYGVAFSLDPTAHGFEDPGRFRVQAGFIEDHLWWAFNLLPFGFLLLLRRARMRVRDLMRSLHALETRTAAARWQAVAARNAWWSRVLRHWVVMIVVAAVVVPVCLLQIDKPAVLEANQQVFWYHPRIGPIQVPYTVFLAFNLTGIVYLFVVLIAMADLIAFVLRGTRLRVDLDHSDGAGGLDVVGHLVSLFLPFVSVLAGFIAFSTWEHSAQDPRQLVADEGALAALALFYAFFLVWPMLPVRAQIVAHVHAEVARIGSKRRRVEEKIRRFLDSAGDFDPGQAEQFTGLRRIADLLRVEEARVGRARVWPMSRRTAWALVVVGVLPALLSAAILVVRSRLAS